MNAGDSRRLAPPPAVLVVLGLLLYVLPLIWNLPLIDPDEGLHAAIAREMVERGDYVVPRLLGVPFLDKPIAFFFAQAVSIRAFGANEFAVRLPGHLFGLLGALSTGILAYVLAGSRAGAAAACIYATLAFPLALNQAAVHDVALVPWTNLAFAFFLLAGQRARATRRVLGWSALAGVCLAVAMLTKGLAGIALVGLPMVVVTLLGGRPTWPVIAGALLGVAIALALASPWYVAVERAEPGYLHYFFVQRHVMGYTTTTQLHGHRDWWYYVPILLAGSAPWVVTGLGALSPRPDTPDGLRALRRVGVVWIVVDVLFLSAAGSKLATYALPVFPAVALVVTSTWLAFPATRGTSAAGHGSALLSTQALIGALLFPAVSLGSAVWAGTEMGRDVWIASLVLACWWLGLAWQATKASARLVFAGSTLGVSFVLVSAYVTLLPAVAQQHTAAPLAAYFNQRHAMPTRLWIVDERVGSFLFYLDPRLRQGLVADQIEGVSLGRALVGGAAVPGTVIALPEDAFRRVAQRAVIEPLILATVDRYRLFDAAVLRSARLRTTQQ